jgi:predicted ATP-dependent protease
MPGMTAPAPRPLAERRPDLAVPPARLRLLVRGADFAVASTEEVAPPDGTVGQERAVEALELALALRAQGYHPFAAGPAGTGRTTTVRRLLEALAATLPVPPDRAYVHRFQDPDRPRLLTFPAGRGRAFASRMEEFREAVRTRAKALLEDPELDRRREVIQKRYAKEEERAFEALRQELARDGLAVVPVSMGGGMVVPELVPLVRGEPVPLEQLEGRVPAETLAELRQRMERDAGRVQEHLRGVRQRQREFIREIRNLVREAAIALVEEELRDVAGPDPPEEVREWLEDVRGDAVTAIVELVAPGPLDLPHFERHIDRYRVNVLADRSDLQGAPIVEERFPTRPNLAGSIERAQDGPLMVRADASTIKGGSLLRADGGFLVLQALDLLSEPGAWDVVKRTIKSGLLEIGGALPGLLGLPRTLHPDPVPVDIKVVLIGERWIYDVLYIADPDFRKLFGVRADFSRDMPLTATAKQRYATVIAGVVEEDGLPPVDADALGALVEQGVLAAGRRNRVSAEFAQIANLLREAAFLARKRNGARVERQDVEEAARRRERREGLIPERLEELLLEGVLLISTSGRAIGQVNGLSVYDLGYHAFGKPTRITAAAAPGRAGIISIEREARLSGGIYDKGVLTIGGFLRRRYADVGPLSLTASLTFEQSYAGVDGDSASIAEVIALLSELSGIPVDQAIAVTGSINQHGEVQPVGGVNEKIIGFHTLCRDRGLDGSHGVVIPIQNIEDLMLPTGIVDDVAAGRFHVFGVGSAEQALEIALDAPVATIDEAVRARLREFAEALARSPQADLPPTSTGALPPATPIPGARET